MCSYDLLDNVYASESKRLLTDILRNEWGFNGIVMSDWGAVNDRVEGVKAGLDLEMPASGGHNDAKIVQAVRSGALNEADLNTVAERLTELILKSADARRKGFKYDAEAHHALARRAAAESAVLLKNDDGILPVNTKDRVAVIGAFAKTPRFQGAGSSQINPTRMDNAFDELSKLGLDAAYAEGYSLKGGDDDKKLLSEAVELAQKCDTVLLFAGLPDAYESEGFDRSSLDMPDSHNNLIEAVTAANPNTAVVLLAGSPVAMPWVGLPKGILMAYLGGQAGGGGIADVITGRVNPSGRLAESFPLKLEDTPCHGNFAADGRNSEYRESIFVGYRYYDTAKKPVLFPFGFGLSYTAFEYSGLKLSTQRFSVGNSIEASVEVCNTGKIAGAEVVQLYVAGPPDGAVFRAARELKGFEKVFLQPDESKTVSFKLDARSFAYYNAPESCWAVEGGEYRVEIGASVSDIKLEAAIQVNGDGKESELSALRDKAPSYYRFAQERTALNVPDTEFAELYGKPIPSKLRVKGEPYTQNSSLRELQETAIGRKVLSEAKKQAEGFAGDSEALKGMIDSMMMDSPLRSIAMMSNGALTPRKVQGVLDMANGKQLRGIIGMLGK